MPGLVLAVIALALAASLLGVAWHVSNRFLIPQPYRLRPEFDLISVEEDSSGEYRVALPVLANPSQFGDVRKEGVYNLLWEGGHGRLGDVLRDDGRRVVRRLTVVEGRVPAAGTSARLDPTIFRRDPWRDHGLSFEELTLWGPAGALGAWWVPGDPKRAVLVLHGRRRSDRRESLRILPTLVASGRSVLVLAYRNHEGSDASPDGLFHYGASEFEDALVALRELAARGAMGIVVYGYSMGGAVALEAVKRWPPDAPSLEGIILDSPLLDPGTVLSNGVQRAGFPVPTLVSRIALYLSRVRSGVSWRELDQRRHAKEFEAPVLLFAGTLDSTIPISLADDFARTVTAPLRYLRLEGVEHVEGWNRCRERYEREVAEFLAGVEDAFERG